MQTLIDIPEANITLLDKLSEDRQISRDELVRTAVSLYLESQLLKQARTSSHNRKSMRLLACGPISLKTGSPFRMGTLEPLFDTNILIDSLKGFDRARNEIDRYADEAISVIAWMEVMAGATSERDTATRVFLKRFEVVPITVESQSRRLSTVEQRAYSSRTRSFLRLLRCKAVR